MTGYYLDVPYASQLGSGPGDMNYDPTGCWYASTCMIGWYFEAGPRLGNPAMYTRVLGKNADGTPKIGHQPISGAAEAQWLKNENLEVVPLPGGGAWTGTALVDLLSKYGPLGVSWFKTANGSTYGHVSVMMGSDNTSNEVIIHDPENLPRSRHKIAAFNKTFMWKDPRPLVRRSGPIFKQRTVNAA